MHTLPEAVQVLPLLALTASAAWMDYRTGRIPNLLTVPPIVLAPIGGFVFGGGSGFAHVVLGALLSALVPYVFYCATKGRAIGGGDLKLMAAIGALGGPSMGLEVQLLSFVLLSAFTLAQLAYRGRLLCTLLSTLRLLLRPFRSRIASESADAVPMTEMKMGPAIFAAASLIVAREHIASLVPWLL